MNQNQTTTDNSEHLALKDFTEKAYLQYAMYVILDRALPHISDGLKPVQRRIIYAMSELGLSATAKYKKSARTVGDVLGKFHPHGDAACYEAMVLMAQPFSFRYPLIDGQGNWGAADDPKSFAAMRYTEARLSPYARLLLAELGEGTVDWTLNFDGTLKEPANLPARVPNVLLNGTTGIAVGMATDIPPHNFCEVVDALTHLIDHPDASIEDLNNYIKGPDLPTYAEIVTPRDQLLAMYTKGIGSYRMRAVYHIENGLIIVTALPYQVSGSKIIEQIAAQMRNKKLPMVADLRDESDHEDPTRLAIVPRSNRVDMDALMAHLFATTDLERNYRVNLNLIGTSGHPQVKGLKKLLSEWLSYRRKTVRCRLQYHLDKMLKRLHILQGLLVVYLNIDDVIAIIRREKDPKKALIQRFRISDIQAEAILELKLRNLAKLEEIKIRSEQKALEQECNKLEKILASGRRLNALMREELIADKKKYGDARRSPIVVRQEARVLDPTKIIPSEPISVILSARGWIRAAKGHDLDPTQLPYKSGDKFKDYACGRTNQAVFFLDSTGRSYALPAHTLPSARSHGEPLSGRVNLPPGAEVQAALMGSANDLVLLSSDAGYGFISALSALSTKAKNGKAVLLLPKNARPLKPIVLQSVESDYVVALSNEGRVLIFPASSLPQQSRGKGNKLIAIPKKRSEAREELLQMLLILPQDYHLVIYSGKRYLNLKSTTLSAYIGKRGHRGRKLPRGFQKVDKMKIIASPQRSLL